MTLVLETLLGICLGTMALALMGFLVIVVSMAIKELKEDF